jgi:membrane protein DedA with SNARE-associated domain
MERRGMWTMFILSAIPNPLVDIAGVAAGAVRMPLSHFYASVLPGKVLKNLYLATGGLAVAELIRRLFG